MTVRAGAAPQRTSPGDQTARDSLVISGCTAVSRASGVVRVVVVGAVLGPTFFGNAFLVTNSLPNLIYFGFLAGSLFTSLLVPALVRPIDEHDERRAAEVSGGFLGIAWTVLLVLVPVAVAALSYLLPVVWSSGNPHLSSDQSRQVRLLILLTAPQVFLYAVIGSATAVMNAHRRFALASAAPAVENLGIIAVLGTVAAVYGPGSSRGASQPLGELLLLGLGSTAAVGVHAALQWWGAHRNGVTLRPRRGWHDPDVVRIIRRSLLSVTQAGLLAAQTLLILALAGRLAGGSVAMQIAFNFYYLPVALVATPIGLAMISRVARLHRRGAASAFADEFSQAVRLAIFLTVPAAVGYVVVAQPLAHVVAAGQMSSPVGTRMVAQSLAALALGLVGQAVFFVSVQAAYARDDTRTPLGSMALQAGVCAVLCGAAVLGPPGRLTELLGVAYAAASLIGGAHLLRRVARAVGLGLGPVLATALRCAVGAALMVAPVQLVVVAVVGPGAGRGTWVIALILAGLTGVATYGLSQALWRSPELARLRSAMRRRRVPVPGADARRADDAHDE